MAVPAPEPPPVLSNLDPSLEAAWHPVALSRELRPGGWLQVQLLGRTWLLRRTDGGLAAEPTAHGVRDRHGVVEVAPAEPAGPAGIPLAVPELGDRRFVSGWLPTVRSPGPAARLIDALVDAAPEPDTLLEEPGGWSGVNEADGRRTTVAVRVPFQLRLREEDLATGAVSTALFMLQPEDADSTRIHTRLLLSAGPGRPLPGPADVVRQMAEVHERLSDEIRRLGDLGRVERAYDAV